MKTTICIALLMSLTGAADAEGPAAGSGKKPLAERILGYWAPDVEAMADDMKRMAKDLAELMGAGRSGRDPAPAEKAALEEITMGFGVMTVEIREGEMLEHMYPGEPGKSPYTIKAQDEKAGTLELEVSGFGGRKSLRKIEFKGDQLVLTGAGDEKEMPMVLKRIDAEAFKKRQKAAAESELFKSEPEISDDLKAPNGESNQARETVDSKPRADGSPGGYPVAEPVPGKPGCVFSPFNRQVIDVSGIPAGTLVQDPTYPASEKKRFRVP